MTAAHTAGPYEVESPLDGELWIVEAGKQAYEWRIIASLPLPDSREDIPRKQVEANANLFAGSPDLLEAADKLCNGWLVDEHENADLCMSAEHYVAIAALFAAIAKCRGGA